MTAQEARVPTSGARWTYRHPRLVAFAMFLLVYTAVATVLSRLFGDPWITMQADWLTGWVRLEPFAFLGGVLAIAFYGPWVHARDHHARNQSAFRGCIVGFLLVPLALLTRAAWDLATATTMRRSLWELWQHQGFAGEMGMSFLYLAFATMYSLLLPEIGGAIAGYLVWRLVGPERG